MAGASSPPAVLDARADSAIPDVPGLPEEQPGKKPGFEVRLANFTGPLDLLLALISKHQLDITEVALATVDRLEDKLAGYHAYHATRADLLRRLGCSEKSRAAYGKAIELAGNTAETAYLTRRRDELG